METVDGTPNIDGPPGISLQKAAKREEEDNVRAWFAWAKTVPDERYRDILDAVDGDGLSALHYAVGSNNLNIVKFMVNNGASVQVKTGSGKTVLHHAAEKNSVAVMRFLVEERDIDIDIDAPDRKGHTPLLTAAFSGSIEAFQFLMISGANIEATGRDGKTAAILAAEHNKARVLEVLLSSSEGAILCTAINRKGGAKGNTALHIAASKGHLDAVKVLLRSNVEIDKKGRGGMTAAHMAAQAGHAHVVGELIHHHRGSLSYRDQNNDTPLHHACFEGHIEIARKLTEAGAVINTGNAEAVTPLHIAAWRGSPELVELLLEKSDTVIDPLSTDERIPRTPLFKACEEGHVVVVKMLLQKGALATGQENRLPFNSIDVAIENGHSDVVLEIVRCDEWRTALRHCSVGYRDDPQRVTSPFRQMIRKMPHIAEEVLNRCVGGHSGFLGQFPLNESEYKITLSYEFFEDFQPPHVSEEDRRRYSVLSDVVNDGNENAVDSGNTPSTESSNQPGQDLTTGKLKKDEHPLVIMVKEKPVLLKHPLVRSLLAYKWQKYGRWVYFLNLFLYLLFLSSLTTYALVLLTPTHPTCSKVFNNTLNESITACEGLSASSYLFIPFVAAVTILLSIGRIGVEVLQMITLQLEYFKDFVNWTELVLYTFTVIFACTFNSQCWCPFPWQWQIGAVAVFLSWIALIIFFQKLHLTGVYVLMFTTILFTFLKLTILALLLVVSFSLSFYMLFRLSVLQIPIFTSPGLSLIRVMTMTAGGVDLDAIFASMNSEPFLTYLIWVGFLVLMPVLLANLLIGLAVDDISGIQQAASLRKRILKAELVSSVEQLIPKKILPASVCQWFTVKTEKTVTLNHKFRNVLEELRWKLWGDIRYASADLFDSSHRLVEAKLAKASTGSDEMKTAVTQLTKQSQEMKDTIGELSQQNNEMKESMLTLINHNQVLQELLMKHITKTDEQFQPDDII